MDIKRIVEPKFPVDGKIYITGTMDPDIGQDRLNQLFEKPEEYQFVEMPNEWPNLCGSKNEGNQTKS